MDAPRTSVLPVAVLLLLAGCGVDEGVVARVGGCEIGVAEVQVYLGAVTGLSWPAVDGRAAERLLDQYLDQEVMVAAAERHRDEAVSSDPALRSATVRVLVTEVCGLPPEPSQEEVERVVASRVEEVRPARAHVRQMLLDSLEAALQAKERLEAGEPFVEVSREVSRAPNAEGGGEMGVLARGTLPEDLDEVVFSLAEGEISSPVASLAGFHVFQVLEVVPEGPAGRDEVEQVVRRELADELSRAFTRRCVEKAADRVGVTVFSDHLWFEYQGRYGEASNDA